MERQIVDELRLPLPRNLVSRLGIKSLRPWQMAALKKSGGRGSMSMVISAPTSGGKTLCAALILVSALHRARSAAMASLGEDAETYDEDDEEEEEEEEDNKGAPRSRAQKRRRRFKGIWLVPFKALTTQVVASLVSYGLRASAFSSDFNDLSPWTTGACDVAVCTFEAGERLIREAAEREEEWRERRRKRREQRRSQGGAGAGSSEVTSDEEDGDDEYDDGIDDDGVDEGGKLDGDDTGRQRGARDGGPLLRDIVSIVVVSLAESKPNHPRLGYLKRTRTERESARTRPSPRSSPPRVVQDEAQFISDLTRGHFVERAVARVLECERRQRWWRAKRRYEPLGKPKLEPARRRVPDKRLRLDDHRRQPDRATPLSTRRRCQIVLMSATLRGKSVASAKMWLGAGLSSESFEAEVRPVKLRRFAVWVPPNVRQETTLILDELEAADEAKENTKGKGNTGLSRDSGSGSSSGGDGGGSSDALGKQKVKSAKRLDIGIGLEAAKVVSEKTTNYGKPAAAAALSLEGLENGGSVDGQVLVFCGTKANCCVQAKITALAAEKERLAIKAGGKTDANRARRRALELILFARRAETSKGREERAVERPAKRARTGGVASSTAVAKGSASEAAAMSAEAEAILRNRRNVARVIMRERRLKSDDLDKLGLSVRPKGAPEYVMRQARRAKERWHLKRLRERRKEEEEEKERDLQMLRKNEREQDAGAEKNEKQKQQQGQKEQKRQRQQQQQKKTKKKKRPRNENKHVRKEGKRDDENLLQSLGLGHSSSIDYIALALMGIAIHNADLSTAERAVVEEGFKKGALWLICCTTTLAAGVNLPASRVVIREFTSYRMGCCTMLAPGKVQQAAGRAGRLGIRSSKV